MLEKIKQNPAIYLTLKMWQFSEGNRPKVVLYFLMSSGACCVNLCGPLVLAKWFNEIQQHGVSSQNINYILSFLLLFLLITLVSWSLHGPSRIMEQTNGFLVKANYRKYLFGGIITLPLKWHNEHHTGNTIDKQSKGAVALGDFSQETFEIIRMIAQLLGAYGMLIYFNIHAAYIVLVTILIASTIVIKFDQIIIGHYYQLNRIENLIAEKIADIINNITTVIILRIENPVLNSIAEKIMSPLKLFEKNNILNEIKWCLVSICTAITNITVLGSFIWVAYKNNTPVLLGSLVALNGYIGAINNLFYEFASKYSETVRRRTRVANSEELVNDFHLCRKITNGKMPRDWHKLSIKNLSFSHRSDGEEGNPHLENISMEIKRGQRIALIGARGSGKTTFSQVVRELYQPTSVTVSVDGQILSKGFTSISSDIALVPQHPEVFHMSILDNITMYIDHDIEYVKRFTDMAQFSEVIERLPKGFNSWINEKGVNLSGGERQSLALARGLMACDDKQIILLDEPTSSVDTMNELAIYQNIFREFPDKTIISSVHKLHLLSMFDVIYFFDDGKIIASGTFDELLLNCPRFVEMWQKYNSLELAKTEN